MSSHYSSFLQWHSLQSICGYQGSDPHLRTQVNYNLLVFALQQNPKDCKGKGNSFILFTNRITDQLNHLQLPHNSLQFLDKFNAEWRMELILFYLFLENLSPNNGTLPLVSLRHRVREESTPKPRKRKAADKPWTAGRNGKMMIYEMMSEQDMLMDLVGIGEWDLPEITADYNDDWDD